MSTTTSASVLIVGAGPSGLCLALSLLRNGVSVRIIEKRPKFQVGQRGTGIQPRTFELLKFLGILPEMLERSDFPPPHKIFKSPDDGTPPQTFRYAEILDDTPSRPYNNYRFLGQEFQEEIYRANILKDYNLEVGLGTELISFEQNADHVVANILKTKATPDGVKQVSETAKFDWLVGADGAQSVVRKQLGLEFLGETQPALRMIIGDIHVKKGSDQTAWCSWGEPSGNYAVLRPYEIPGDDRYNFCFGGSGLDLDKIVSSRDEIVKTMHELTGWPQLEFGDLVDVYIWRPNIRMVNKFSEGRVIVVGDAAHVHPPAGGQGMNSGVQDAVNLSWKLALIQKGLASSKLLTTYTAERLPVIATMLNKTTELHNALYKPNIEHNVRWARGYELRLLGVNYRGSPLVVDEKHDTKDLVHDPYRSGEDGTVMAGDRAPDAPNLVQFTSGFETSTITLFDIFKPTYHTALVFSHPDQVDLNTALVKVLSSYPEGTVKIVFVFPQSSESTVTSVADGLDGLVLLDQKGFAYQHYAVDEAGVTVVIVRPDGYIGALVGGRTPECSPKSQLKIRTIF